MSISCSFEGALTKKPIPINFKQGSQKGIYFVFPDGSQVEANVKNLASATRNTVLGAGENRICFVEHLLTAVNLLKIDSLMIEVKEPEIPLGDGSSMMWLELLQAWQQTEKKLQTIQFKETFSVQDESGRAIIAYPHKNFKMTYLFQSPIDGNQTWASWEEADGAEKLARARTFASVSEHEMLGLKGKMLSYDSKGFDLPLHCDDEPALHKLLDLFGDLSLSGKNPLSFSAHFVSVKGGHSLNTQMAKLLQEKILT